MSFVKVRTSVSQPNFNEYAGSESGRDQDLRSALWKSLPLVSIQNGGVGAVSARITGTDIPGDGSRIEQKVRCCLSIFKNVSFSTTVTVPDGQPLGLRMWSWNVCRNSSDDGYVKCNRNRDALNYTKGSFIHTHVPGNTDPLPFSPSFDSGYYNDANLSDEANNSFNVLPGEIRYFVPNRTAL